MPLIKAPIPTQPDSIEREYLRFLLKYQRTYMQLVRHGLSFLLPQLRAQGSATTPQALVERMDANIDDEILRLFATIGRKLESIFPDAVLERWSLAMARRTHQLSVKNQSKHIKKTAKATKNQDVEIEGILTADKKLTPYFKNIVDQNVGLIRSIPLEKMLSFKNGLVSAINQDMNVRDISKIIQKNFKTTESKARLIARDQVGKLNGALDEYHQRTIGVKRYRWRNMRDKAVRGNPGGLYPPHRGQNDHWKLEGEIFSWDKPPKMEDGRRLHPKQDYQCRCYAEAVLEDVL